MTRRGFMKVAAMGTGSVAAGGGMASDGGSRSDAQSVTGAETGDRFVRVGESDGKWWFLQPDGKRTLFSGVANVAYEDAPCTMSGVKRYARNHQVRGEAREAWGKKTAARLRDWGFNLVTISYPLPTLGMQYASGIALGRDASRETPACSIVPFKSVHASNFPNVFEPAFADACRRLAKERCAPERDNPQLVGWFIDNELLWTGGVHPDGLFGLVAELPEGHSAKVVQQRFLAERGWAGRKADAEVKNAFLALVAERYFAITSAAIREADPNHLVMGCRFAGIHSLPDAVYAACGKYCDVVSVNVYPAADLDHGYVREQFTFSRRSITHHFDRVWKAARKPIIVTEWSFPAMDTGLPSMLGSGQRFRTQRERAEATELFGHVMCALPYVVGFVHFTWADQPPTPNPENCNYGIVNVNDEPYPELVAAFKRINANLEKWHLGEQPPRKKRAPNDVSARAKALECKGMHPGSFRQEPDGTFIAENGAFKLEGKIGERGLHAAVGTFKPWIHEVMGGRKLWTPIEKVESVQGGVEDGLLVFECEFSGWHKPHERKLRARFFMPADRPHFLFEPLSVTNIGPKPTEVRSVYGLLTPPADGVYRQGSASHGRPIENIWGGWSYAAWINAAGRFTGCIGNERDGVAVHYWDTPGEGLHSDATISLCEPATLKTDDRYTFDERPYLLFTFGAGGEWAWQRRLFELGVD